MSLRPQRRRSTASASRPASTGDPWLPGVVVEQLGPVRRDKTLEDLHHDLHGGRLGDHQRGCPGGALFTASRSPPWYVPGRIWSNCVWTPIRARKATCDRPDFSGGSGAPGVEVDAVTSGVDGRHGLLQHAHPGRAGGVVGLARDVGIDQALLHYQVAGMLSFVKEAHDGVVVLLGPPARRTLWLPKTWRSTATERIMSLMAQPVPIQTMRRGRPGTSSRPCCAG